MSCQCMYCVVKHIKLRLRQSVLQIPSDRALSTWTRLSVEVEMGPLLCMCS